MNVSIPVQHHAHYLNHGNYSRFLLNLGYFRLLLWDIHTNMNKCLILKCPTVCDWMTTAAFINIKILHWSDCSNSTPLQLRAHQGRMGNTFEHLYTIIQSPTIVNGIFF